MNRYPLWKYILLIIVVIVGIIYALPNIYGDNPAIQISKRNGGYTNQTIARIQKTLRQDNLNYKSISKQKNDILIRFNDTDTQLKAINFLKNALGNNYIVAVNLAPATPGWLSHLNAKPMYLGLDLRGGVYFLLQIDSNAAIDQQLNRDQQDIKHALAEKHIPLLNLTKGKEKIILHFPDQAAIKEALKVLRSNYQNLIFMENGQKNQSIIATLSKRKKAQIEQYAMQQNITTLRNRVNELGVAQPIIQRQGKSRIVVELPGVQDTARAKAILGATAGLQFRMVDEKAGNPETAAQTGNIPFGSQLFYEKNNRPILLSDQIILTGDYITDASAGFEQQSNSPAVFITLDGRGAKLMSQATRNNVGRLMAVVFVQTHPVFKKIKGKTIIHYKKTMKVINVARVQEQLGKRFQITGLQSIESARNLALLLRAGSLAAPMSIIEERTIGPSLGKHNIQQGFNSALIGFSLVVIFMALYYRFFGLIADFALCLNVILILAIMSILQATLTLPGIAGITLTVGMAVDANVLIFERIREELRNGNSPQASIHAGYDRAMATIIDSNITTLIAAIILFIFGTGAVKGFAVTLSIGIVTSMFTAIMGTRAVVNLMYGGRRKLKKLAI